MAVSPFAEPIGHPAATLSRGSFTTVDVAFATLIATAHAVVVAESDERPASVISCGEVGGMPADDGSLVVGLRQMAGSEVAGVAVLSPNVLDPALTDVSVFLADGLQARGAVSGADVAEPVSATTAVAIQLQPAAGAATPAADPAAGL